jgi:hypothetical protein
MMVSLSYFFLGDRKQAANCQMMSIDISESMPKIVILKLL